MIQSETLELLEWPRLCQHLATFTATKLGAILLHNSRTFNIGDRQNTTNYLPIP
ncbi:MAG: hypothetical protein F6K08_18920, partial [Okeania sp. SIO1H6]|nr:hypothetical protein [Okeania sp. SIO1H6]